MRRTIISLALAALAIASPVFAQSQNDFRSAGSGLWSDSQIWEKNDGGIWLKPGGNSYPGDSHNRQVDVTVGDGSSVMIAKDEVVEINSLGIIDGRLLVEGTLIVGPAQNDPENPVISSTVNSQITQNPVTPIAGDSPQLLQNVPNPLAPQFGYETTIKFYIDQQYSNATLTIYDQLGHIIQRVFQEENPEIGWHEIRVRLDRISSGTYPLLLELPNNILRRMITVLK